MTHILMKNYGGAHLMICGESFDGPPTHEHGMVGVGKGRLEDGETTAAEQAASVDCKGCADKFPVFNEGRTLDSLFLADGVSRPSP